MKKILSILIILCLILNFTSCSYEQKATDVFGLGMKSDVNGEYYNYFELPKNWQKYESKENYKLSDQFVFEKEEEYEDNEENSFIMKTYSCGLGTVPVIDACGTAKIIAQEFALQNLDSNICDLCYQEYPIFYSKDMTTYYYDSLFEEKTITKELYKDDKSIYSVYQQKETDVVINNSGINDIPKLDNIESETIGYDALVFFTSKENPIDSLTQKQIRDIYSGNIVNWKEISSYDMKIDAYTRGECTQNRTYFDNVVMKDITSKKFNYTKTLHQYIFEDFETNEYPAEFSNEQGSIGYGYKSLVESFYGSNVKILNVDSIEPSETNIQQNKYPYTIEITASTRVGKSGELGRQVVHWFLSENGKNSLSQRNLIPIK